MRDSIVILAGVGTLLFFASKANASSGGDSRVIARRLIKNTEQLSLTPYQDEGGTWHIGYGHKLSGKPSYTKISQYRADVLLTADINEATRAVDRLVKIPLNPYQKAALVSFTFNLGPGALGRSTLLRDLNSGHIDAAADQFRRWVYVNGQRSSGLATRREAEKQVFNYSA